MGHKYIVKAWTGSEDIIVFQGSDPGDLEKAIEILKEMRKKYYCVTLEVRDKN